MPPLKLYVHYEGDPPFTKILRPNDDALIESLLQQFAEAYNERHPRAPLHAEDLAAYGPNQKPLQRASKLGRVLAADSDVQVTLDEAACSHAGSHANAGTAVPATPSTAAAPPPEAHNTAAKAPVAERAVTHAEPGTMDAGCQSDGSTASNTSGDGGVNSGVTASPEHQQRLPQQQLDKTPEKRPPPPPPPPKAPQQRRTQEQEQYDTAQRVIQQQVEEAIRLQNYRTAGELLQQAVQWAPDASARGAALRSLAEMWLQAGNPSRAVRWAQQAADDDPDDLAAQELAGNCLCGLGRHRDALPYYQHALTICAEAAAATTAAPAAQQQQQPQQPSGKGEANGGTAGAAPPALTIPDGAERRLRVAMGRALFACKDAPELQELAASVVMAVLKEHDQDWGALWLYAEIAAARGLRDDALRVALRLVVAQPKHKGAKALLADCLKDDEGMQTLVDELAATQPQPPDGASAAGTAAALAFLASSIKDHGVVDGAISLLDRAVAQMPLNPSYSLNYVHALELRQALAEAVAAGCRYCRECRLRLAGHTLQGVDTLLAGLPPLPKATEPTWLEAEPWRPPRSLAERRAEAAAAGLPAPAAVDDPMAAAGTTAGPGTTTFNSDELDCLALLFTMAKVLYVGGALTSADRLCDLVEPIRRASAVALHTTLIRNEAAYFGCVLQLLKDHPPPPPVPAGLPAAGAITSGRDAATGRPRPLYLCGDSHCLSGAWRHVTLRGEVRLLHPLLVTGCKVWHLRPSSCFYPKVQFHNTLDLLPDGAQLVMCLGEIDCREGLILAVQKGKYESLADAMRATIAIYIAILERLVLERGFEVFVHPVPPVLNETRSIVKPFTAMLQAAVLQAAAKGAARGRLHYLDFFEDLLTPDGSKLDPELVFDGTHMAPAYVRHLDARLSRIT